MVLAGTAKKIIAADLAISQRTVENHRALIMRKFKAKSLAELLRLALAGGRRSVTAPLTAGRGMEAAE